MGVRMLSVIGLCVALASPVAAVEEPSLAEALRAAVDKADPAGRREAADLIASRRDADIASVVKAIRELPPRGVAQPGFHRAVADLPTGDGLESTAIHVYVPESYDAAKPAPLLFAHHGAGGEGSTEPRRWKDVADALGMVVVSPTDGDPVAGYKFLPRERELALGALRWARRTFNVDSDRVLCTGFSRGGHLTWDLALRHPGIFAAIAPVVGGPRLSNQRGENNLRFLENLVGLPIRDLQGAGDDRYLVANLRMAFRKLEAWRATDAELIVFPDLGHDADMSAVDWKVWFGEARRDPVPERVVLRTLGPPHSRAFWVEALRVGRGVREKVAPSVDARKWARMSNDEKREFMADAVEKRTGRVEARFQAPGSFDVRGKGVERVRLLLTPSMFVAGEKVSIRWNGRSRKKTVRPSVKVLLRDFVERLDPSFLPVAEVTVP
ncbi:MAG: carboxylesterase family protein [Planctomycetota bacterium]